MYMIELDVSHEASVEEINAFANTYKSVATLVDPEGPAGGNPVYSFTSYHYDELLELATEFLNDKQLAENAIEAVPV